uniref:Uncharacterized protein n=1 Tax=Rhizophora mucronata TaxID=61149 RepID=A0A2P2Q4A3_RHIMU
MILKEKWPCSLSFVLHFSAFLFSAGPPTPLLSVQLSFISLFILFSYFIQSIKSLFPSICIHPLFLYLCIHPCFPLFLYNPPKTDQKNNMNHRAIIHFNHIYVL